MCISVCILLIDILVGGTPVLSWLGGGGGVYPNPVLARGYPSPVLVEGMPVLGYPHLGQGYPVWEWGTRRPETGVPPPGVLSPRMDLGPGTVVTPSERT